MNFIALLSAIVCTYLVVVFLELVTAKYNKSDLSFCYLAVGLFSVPSVLLVVALTVLIRSLL